MSRFRPSPDESGFSLIELVVATTVMATAFVGLSRATSGGLAGLNAVRSRSSFTEVANAELEAMRADDFTALGVSSTDPNLYASYGGRAAVVVSASANPRPAVSVVNANPTSYTVNRYVTWSPDIGSQQVKRLDVVVTWTEPQRGTRTAAASTLRYPGGNGVLNPNQQPTASATATPTSGKAPLAVSFDGRASSDPDGSIVSWAWQFGDGATGSGSTVSHTYASAGTYSAVLTVTDDGGLTSVTTLTITVNANRAPTASFTLSANRLTITVNASASSDPDGDALTYSWNWGDGTANGSGVTATHTYSAIGNWTTTLTVTDTSAATGTATNKPCLVSNAQVTNFGVNVVQWKAPTNQWAKSPTFTFAATTNQQCTSLSISLNATTGTQTKALTSSGTTTKTWSGSASYGTTILWPASGTGTTTTTGGAAFTFTYTSTT